MQLSGIVLCTSQFDETKQSTLMHGIPSTLMHGIPSNILFRAVLSDVLSVVQASCDAK